MPQYDVAIIGTGPGPGDGSARGYATTDPSPSSMGYKHAQQYDQLENCRLVACADLVEEHARRFVEAFDLAESAAYTDHEEMLAAADPDVVSVCAPTPTHSGIVVDCAASGVPRAIHCEKPMAHTWKACRLMVQECERRDIQLTIGHHQRMSPSARKARDLVADGAIGDLQRVEVNRMNLFDAGIHQIDLCNYLAGDRPPEWVLAGLGYEREYVKKGVPQENPAVALWQYEDATGLAAIDAEGFLDTTLRVVGTDGVLERGNNATKLRVHRSDSAEPETVDCGDDDPFLLKIRHIIDCLAAGTEPLVNASDALAASEIAFGARESARRRARVELPLTVDDDPLTAMIEAGEIGPTRD